MTNPTLARMRAAVAPLIAKVRGRLRGRIHVIAEHQEVPAGLPDLPDLRDWHGAHLPAQQVILLNTTTLAHEGHARFTLRHELAHAGLRSLLGRARVKAFEAVRRANAKVRAEAGTWFSRHGMSEIVGRMRRGLAMRKAAKQVAALATEEALADRAGLGRRLKPKQVREAMKQQALRLSGRWKHANRLESRTQAETSLLLAQAAAQIMRCGRFLRTLPKWRPAKWRAQGLSRG